MKGKSQAVGKKQPEPLGKVEVSKYALLGPWRETPETPVDNFKDFLKKYLSVPVVSSAIDTIVDECMSEGYELRAIGNYGQPEVDSWARDCHLHAKIRNAIKGRLVFGNWFMVRYFDNTFYGGKLPCLQGLPPWILGPVPDKKGGISEYKVNGTTSEETIDVNDVAFWHGDIITDSVWGTGLIHAAYTEISFKQMMEEQNFNIDRQYAFPIFLIVPSKEIKNIASGEMATLMRRFDSMVSQQEKTRIVGLPNAVEVGILGVERKIPEAFIAWESEHNDTQLYIKLRVPPVMLERGQNATEATAKVQLGAHNRFIKSNQHESEEILNTDVFLDLNGEFFAEIEFNEPVEPSFQAGAGMKQEGKQGQKGEPSKAPEGEVTDWLRIAPRFKATP